MRMCAIVNCGQGDYQLNRWKKTVCEEHGCNKGVAHCLCPAPFDLFMFPKEKTLRMEWIKLVNRKGDGGKNWTPAAHHRICSRHFVDGKPSGDNPLPSLELGYMMKVKTRRPPKSRQLLISKRNNMHGGAPVPSCSTDPVKDTPVAVGLEELLKAVVADPNTDTLDDNLNDSTSVCDPNSLLDNDHDYCGAVNTVTSISDKDAVISQLQRRINELESVICKQSAELRQASSFDVCEQFVKTNELVKKNTGLQNVGVLDALCTFLKSKAERMRYWEGAKRSLKTTGCQLKHVNKRINKTKQSTPKKTGTRRQLSVKSELVLVLMKLRLGLSNAFLAQLFKISSGSCSSILNTWIRLLSQELKGLVFWPDKEIIKAMMPVSLAKKYPNLRCTIDCSETFINRPRDLYLQAATWSDYKHHNTVKYLVAIAPNGHISFISQAWGGRATDRFIVQQSGMLNLIDPGDIVLADRGFTIQDDLLFRQASLVIPPPGSGKAQMTSA